MLRCDKRNYKGKVGQCFLAVVGIGGIAACASHAEAPLTKADAVVATLQVDGGRLSPTQQTETHSVQFEDGSLFELSFVDRAYSSSYEPELISISLDGSPLGPRAKGYGAATSVFSEMTLKTIHEIYCETSENDACDAVKVSFTGVYTAEKQARVSEDDDLRCILKVEMQPVSVSVDCRAFD